MVKVRKGKAELKLQFDAKKDNFVIGGRKMPGKIGEKKVIRNKKGRKITMKRIAKTGFPQWKIIKNQKA